MTTTILVGDCREKLRDLPDGSIHCCVTSPPYFGLRDYGHVGQMGMETTPDEYVAGMVEVFREVHRVLRDDGTLWLNIGDSYARNGGTPGGGNRELMHLEGKQRRMLKTPAGLKEKDLCGIPWLLAFALRNDGWYLRQEIIWHKPNPMPESVTDRCTKAHEQIFLLSKNQRYYFDNEAISEPVADATISRLAQDVENQRGSDRVPGKTNGPMKAVRRRADRFGGNKHHGGTTKHSDGSIYEGRETRNKRSVWTVTTKPFKGAHFAVFPPDLIEPCIMAGCPAGGTVLDPFGGAGTTALVANQHDRHAILIELNLEYAEIARDRLGLKLIAVDDSDW